MRGHIRRRGKRSWELIVPAGRNPTTGKKQQKFRTVRGTKRDAEVELARWIHEIETGLDVARPQVTVSEYLDEWLESKRLRVEQGRLRPRTFSHYEQKVRLHVVPIIGNLRLAKLRPQDIEGVYAAAFKAGLSSQSVLHIHRVLFSALRQAVQWQQVTRNVAEAVEPPPRPRHTSPSPTLTDLPRLLASVDDSWLMNPTIVALGTGLRLGELFALRWENVDFEARSIRVRESLQVDGSFTPPKTEKSAGMVYLPQFALEAFRRQRSDQNRRRLQMGDRWVDHDLVFDSGCGAPVSTPWASRSFSKRMKDAGLLFTFHSLRHGHGSLLHASGADLKVISENLRHANIGITADTYLHVEPSARIKSQSQLHGYVKEVFDQYRS